MVLLAEDVMPQDNMVLGDYIIRVYYDTSAGEYVTMLLMLKNIIKVLMLNDYIIMLRNIIVLLGNYIKGLGVLLLS